MASRRPTFAPPTISRPSVAHGWTWDLWARTGRTVVRFVDPFYYPQDMVDMNKIGHTDETTRDDSHVSSREQDVAGHVWRDKML